LRLELKITLLHNSLWNTFDVSTDLLCGGIL